jgi:hypothetical protein
VVAEQQRARPVRRWDDLQICPPSLSRLIGHVEIFGCGEGYLARVPDGADVNTTILCTENRPHQKPFPSLDLSEASLISRHPYVDPELS